MWPKKLETHPCRLSVAIRLHQAVERSLHQLYIHSLTVRIYLLFNLKLESWAPDYCFKPLLWLRVFTGLKGGWIPTGDDVTPPYTPLLDTNLTVSTPILLIRSRPYPPTAPSGRPSILAQSVLLYVNLDVVASPEQSQSISSKRHQWSNV